MSSSSETPARRRQPLVSIVLATYNFERFLARSIESALAQDYPRESLEIIVIDDGSTDATPQVVEPYLDEVRYIRKLNGGVLSTFDRGFAEARGEYIALLSGDDEYLPHKTRRQVELLEARPEVGLVYGDMEMVDADGATLAPSFWAAARIKPLRGRFRGSLLANNCVSGGPMMVRASLKDSFHPFPAEAAWEDWYVALKVSEVAQIDYLPEPVYRYRRHENNMSLGAAGDRQMRSMRTEVGFRRWLLRSLEPGQASVEEIAKAWNNLAHIVGALTDRGDSPDDLLKVTYADREQAEQAYRRALESGDAVALANALGTDPGHTAAAKHLGELLVAREAAPQLEGARSLTTLAYADELVADAGLLEAYAGCFGPDDDATLVVFADEGSGTELFERLADAVEGLAHGGPDMLAVAGDDDLLAATSRSVRAVYSRRSQTGPLATLPRVDADSVGELRALAAR